MKKILFLFLGAVSMFSTFMLEAQTFTMPSDPGDTIIIPTSGPWPNTTYSNITNITGTALTIKWHVYDCNFPTDWLTYGALQICDDEQCRPTSLVLNSSGHSGPTYSPVYGANATHDSTGLFDLGLDLSNVNIVTSGPHYIKITLVDQGTGNYTKNLTVIYNKAPVSVPSVNNAVSDIVLYPNPARDELNVVYEGTSDIKNIAVYNIIGKVMTVYRVSGSSANLNLENIPSGIYFVRLLNSQGNAVVTKKFTKQ